MKNQTENTNGTVGMDLFLYSCFEFEQTAQHLPGKMQNDQRWPKGIELENSDSNTDKCEEPLNEMISTMIGWYRTNTQNIEEPVCLEVLSDIVPVIVMIAKDLNAISETKNGTPLPPLGHTETDVIWKCFLPELKSGFAQQHDFFIRYLSWAFSSSEEEKFELGSRPPVGKYSPNFRRLAALKAKNEKRDNPRSHPKERDNPRSHSKERNGPGNRNNPRPQKRDRSRAAPDKKKNAQLEREALKTVLTGVQQLNEDDSLIEVKLPPANSYYRRLQHQQAKTEGLDSKSTGEGSERAVVLFRMEEGKESKSGKD